MECVFTGVVFFLFSPVFCLFVFFSCASKHAVALLLNEFGGICGIDSEFAFSNPAPAVYYYEFGFGTIEPLVEEREFSLSVDEYTHEYYT